MNRKNITTLLTSIALPFLLSFSLPTSASSSDTISKTICELVQENDKKALQAFLRGNRLKVRNIYNGVRCNGMSVLNYSESTNAFDAGVYIVGRLPKKQLAKELLSLKIDGEIYQAALARSKG